MPCGSRRVDPPQSTFATAASPSRPVLPKPGAAERRTPNASRRPIFTPATHNTGQAPNWPPQPIRNSPLGHPQRGPLPCGTLALAPKCVGPNASPSHSVTCTIPRWNCCRDVITKLPGAQSPTPLAASPESPTEQQRVTESNQSPSYGDDKTSPSSLCHHSPPSTLLAQHNTAAGRTAEQVLSRAIRNPRNSLYQAVHNLASAQQPMPSLQ